MSYSVKYKKSDYINCTYENGKYQAFNPFSAKTEELTRDEVRLLNNIQKNHLDEKDIISSFGQNSFLKLKENKMLIPEKVNQDKEFFLKFIQIDTNTICNQRCTYCPVSRDPRGVNYISEELFDSILEQLKPYKLNIEYITLSSYNEPTIDPKFKLWIKKIREHGFHYWFISNGSNLKPDLTDFLLENQVNSLILNLPSVDGEEYYKLKGIKDLDKVLKYVTYALSSGMKMSISVLGDLSKEHLARLEKVKQYFNAFSGANVYPVIIVNRAGNLSQPKFNKKKLRGCMSNFCRLFNWVHINSEGKCFICCQDFKEDYIIGDLKTEALEQILRSDKMSQLKRWAYGVENAPDNFICRKCEFAITED